MRPTYNDGNKILILSYGSLLETGEINKQNISDLNGVSASVLDIIEYNIEMYRTPNM